MTADTITNRIIRLQRRRLVMKRIHQDAQLTRETIAALYRTSQHADNSRLIRWAINEMPRHDNECDCDECAYRSTRSKQ